MGLEKPAASPSGGIFCDSSAAFFRMVVIVSSKNTTKHDYSSWYACFCLSPILTGASDMKAVILFCMRWSASFKYSNLESLFTSPDRERCLVTLFAPANFVHTYITLKRCKAKRKANLGRRMRNSEQHDSESKPHSACQTVNRSKAQQYVKCNARE